MEQESTPSPKKSSVKPLVPFLAGVLLCIGVFLVYRVVSGSGAAMPTPMTTPTPDSSIMVTTTPDPNATSTLAPDVTATTVPDATPGTTASATATAIPTATTAAEATATPPAVFVPDYLPGDANIIGNFSYNIVNGGHIASQGNWIYYPVPTSLTDSDLYKIRTDGTGKTLITTDETAYLNVVDDWIYYKNLTDGGKLWKIRTDGSLATKIADEPADFITVAGDWVYYSVPLTATTGELRKCHKDGTVRRRLAMDYASSLYLWSGYLYYINSADNYIWKCDLDGLNHRRVDLDDAHTAFPLSLNVNYGGIYYTSAEAGTNAHKIFNIQTNGTGWKAVALSSPKGFNLIVDGDFIYYANFGPTYGSLSRIQRSTWAVTPINSTPNSLSQNLFGEWLYFLNYGDGNSIYRVKTDGTGQVKFG